MKWSNKTQNADAKRECRIFLMFWEKTNDRQKYVDDNGQETKRMRKGVVKTQIREFCEAGFLRGFGRTEENYLLKAECGRFKRGETTEISVGQWEMVNGEEGQKQKWKAKAG